MTQDTYHIGRRITASQELIGKITSIRTQLLCMLREGDLDRAVYIPMMENMQTSESIVRDYIKKEEERYAREGGYFASAVTARKGAYHVL